MHGTSIRPLQTPSPGGQAIEVVERKGLGHPDTICDAIAEHVCVRLCAAYVERFGAILHHNVDKVLLVAGDARPELGGGTVLAPIELYLGGRATSEYRGARIPAAEIAVEAARDWLRLHVPGIDPLRGVRILPRLGPGSNDLTALFARGGGRLANDTSIGVGFAPYTDLERVVLGAERALNARQTRANHPVIGQDVKVMGVRRGDRVELTVACAMVARHAKDLDAYLRAKETAKGLVRDAARAETSLPVDIVINAADRVEQDEIFLTVTGTSAESGDDGEVGRGNRANGLITPYRAMTLEAAAGKNPATHAGKIYSLVAHRIAGDAARLPRATDATCTLVSRIGHPLDEPQLADLQIAVPDGVVSSADRAAAVDIVRANLASIDEVQRALLAERLLVY